MLLLCCGLSTVHALAISCILTEFLLKTVLFCQFLFSLFCSSTKLPAHCLLHSVHWDTLPCCLSVDKGMTQNPAFLVLIFSAHLVLLLCKHFIVGSFKEPPSLFIPTEPEPWVSCLVPNSHLLCCVMKMLVESSFLMLKCLRWHTVSVVELIKAINVYNENGGGGFKLKCVFLIMSYPV